MIGASELADFAFALRDLAAAYRKDSVDERMVSSYWDGLEDLPLPQVLEGMKLAKRESRFLPSVAVLRDCARQAAQSSPGLTVAKPTLPPGEVFCPRCEDTGFAYLRQDGQPYATLTQAVLDSARKVTPCACRPRNAAYQWKRSQDRRSAAKELG